MHDLHTTTGSKLQTLPLVLTVYLKGKSINPPSLIFSALWLPILLPVDVRIYYNSIIIAHFYTTLKAEVSFFFFFGL